jgi:hypothetical protein
MHHLHLSLPQGITTIPVIFKNMLEQVYASFNLADILDIYHNERTLPLNP